MDGDYSLNALSKDYLFDVLFLCFYVSLQAESFHGLLFILIEIYVFILFYITERETEWLFLVLITKAQKVRVGYGVQ